MSGAPQDKADAPLEGDADVKAQAAAGAQASASPIRVRYAGRTAVGLVREHNEDNLVIANLDVGQASPRGQVCDDAIGPSGMMFAVCDGMGGAAAGEVASKMAVDVLLEVLGSGGPPCERDDLARRLVTAVQEAGRRIFNEAQKERTKRGMGTTATVAVLLDKILFVAEVGDSRAYLLRNGVLRQLTKDQSLVNQLIEAGHLTEEEAEAFEHSNIILQALGTSESVQVDLTFVELRRGDRLMLCSDGLSGLVHDESIRDALHEVADPAECTSLLIEYAEGGGGHDNITVIVADFDGEELAEPKPEDDFGYVQYPLLPKGGVPNAFVDDEEQGTPVGGMRAQPLTAAQVSGTNEGQRSGASWLWLLAGMAALSVGAYLMLLSSPEAESRANLTQGQGGPAGTANPVGAEAPAEPESEVPVVVRVHTDVEDARLMVNGEAYGPLSASESFPLKLPPGAYRFEAEAEGNILAVSVVTVRPDEPLDVHLNLPEGSEAGGPATGIAREDQGDDGTAPAETAPPDNPRGERGLPGGAVEELDQQDEPEESAHLAERKRKTHGGGSGSASTSTVSGRRPVELPQELQREPRTTTTLRPNSKRDVPEPVALPPAGTSGVVTGTQNGVSPVIKVSPETPLIAPTLPENPY